MRTVRFLCTEARVGPVAGTPSHFVRYRRATFKVAAERWWWTCITEVGVGGRPVGIVAWLRESPYAKRLQLVLRSLENGVGRCAMVL